ncbi:MAG TPA: RNA-binding domain-containing protein [Candidatus Thermoplasmatota archaeon]|nr:RNA-binding domain-containing protein [Candidatus Thermoplasmatota archaeon]
MERETFRYHWLKLRAVAHPTEELPKVRAAVRFVSGLPEDAFALVVADLPMETHHGLTSHVLEATVERSRALRDVLERVLAVPGARERLRATLDARTDEDGLLYVRLDKQAAAQGRLELTQGEDCVQLRLKVEAYPAGRAAALAMLARLLESARP